MSENTRPTVYYSRACVTKYLGPTYHRGARVKATHVNTRKSVTIPWSYKCDALTEHAQAAAQLLETSDLIACSIDGGGYVFFPNSEPLALGEPVRLVNPPKPSIKSGSHFSATRNYGGVVVASKLAVGEEKYRVRFPDGNHKWVLREGLERH